MLKVHRGCDKCEWEVSFSPLQRGACLVPTTETSISEPLFQCFSSVIFSKGLLR